MRILIISDSPLLTTGYGVVAKKLGQIFSSMGCEVRQITFGLHEEVEYDYKLYPVPKNDYFGRTIFENVLNDFLPQIVLTYHDLNNVAWLCKYPNRFFQWWAYFPVDAEKLTRTQIAIINSVDLPIVYSRSALYAVTLDTNRFDTKLIYHGVDSEKFKPVEDKEALKAQFGLKNKFIVGSVNRNVTRKNFPALIKAFAKFAENKNDVLLYLHTKPNDFLGHNLYEFISECGIQDKVLITKDLDSVNGIDTEDLVKVYNLFDLHVTCSAGEGLGLSILESELCGVPNLATDFSACREFVTKNMRIAVKAFYYEGFQWNTQRAIVDEDDLVNKLNTYYKYRGILPLIGEQHRKYIETFDWKYIEALWKLLFIQNGCKDNDILSDFIRI